MYKPFKKKETINIKTLKSCGILSHESVGSELFYFILSVNV